MSGNAAENGDSGGDATEQFDLNGALSVLAEYCSNIDLNGDINTQDNPLYSRTNNGHLAQRNGETSENIGNRAPPPQAVAESRNLPLQENGHSSRVPAGSGIVRGTAINQENIRYRQLPRRLSGNWGQTCLLRGRVFRTQRRFRRGFCPGFGGPLWRRGGDRGLYGARNTLFTGALPPFGRAGNARYNRVVPHVNPVFFGRGVVLNGMGMVPTPNMGIRSVPDEDDRDRGESSRTHNGGSMYADNGKSQEEGSSRSRDSDYGENGH